MGISLPSGGVGARVLPGAPIIEMRQEPFGIMRQAEEINGGRSSVGRAPDCGSGGRGFEPHRPPHFLGGRYARIDKRAISSIGRAVDS